MMLTAAGWECCRRSSHRAQAAAHTVRAPAASRHFPARFHAAPPIPGRLQINLSYLDYYVETLETESKYATLFVVGLYHAFLRNNRQWVLQSLHAAEEGGTF